LGKPFSLFERERGERGSKQILSFGQTAHQIILEELASGSWKTKVPKLTIKDVEDNTMLLLHDLFYLFHGIWAYVGYYASKTIFYNNGLTVYT